MLKVINSATELDGIFLYYIHLPSNSLMISIDGIIGCNNQIVKTKIANEIVNIFSGKEERKK